MATIAIEKTDLIGAEQMAAFLERRMADIIGMDRRTAGEGHAASELAIDAYVCSQTYADEKAGSLLLLKSHGA